MKSYVCLNCKQPLEKAWQQKFCSNQCQADARYESFKIEWLEKRRKIQTKNISGHIKRFLLETSGERCSQCGWNTKHQSTLKVPLEVDHLDGDSGNNQKENLRLLCPNCHALTPSFRNLNKGKGRTWRKTYASK